LKLIRDRDCIPCWWRRRIGHVFLPWFCGSLPRPGDEGKVRGQIRLSSKCRDSTRANDQNDVRRSRSATVTLDEYCALDESCALIMKPFGKDSAILRFEEFAPNSDIYARVADELDVYFRPMDPPPATKSEAAARAIFMVRNLGFFSANRSAGEAAAMLGLTMTELCSRPIADDVMEFLAGHLLAGHQAALGRGFAGATETVQ
jgi:hypothetical protein